MSKLNELDKLRLNLDGAIRILQAIDQDLRKLEVRRKPTLAEIREQEYELEDRADVVKQNQALWGRK